MGTQRGFARAEQPHTGAQFGGLSGLCQSSGWYLSHLSPEAAWGRLQEVKQTGMGPVSGWYGAELFLAVRYPELIPPGGQGRTEMC